MEANRTSAYRLHLRLHCGNCEQRCLPVDYTCRTETDLNRRSFHLGGEQQLRDDVPPPVTGARSLPLQAKPGDFVLIDNGFAGDGSFNGRSRFRTWSARQLLNVNECRVVLIPRVP